MQSPITGKENVKLIKEFNSELIVDLYKKDLGIDISSYFKNIPLVSLNECIETKYKFYYPFSIEGTSEFYHLLSASSIKYYPGWKWENEVASKYIPDNANIIDVGCGDGTFISKIKTEKNLNTYGVEFNPDAISKAEAKGIKIYNRELGDLAKEYSGYFDVATSFQVLEHISQVKEFLKSKAELVKNGGRVIIGVPYNKPYLYKRDKYHVLNLPPHHMGLWNETSLANLQNYFPLKLEAIHIEPLDEFSYYLFVQLRASKLYKKMHRLKIFRVLFRMTNTVFSPVSKKIKGRNIVAVFKKV